MGPNVKGGHYGQPSSFAAINHQWDRFDMTTDFRNVLGTVIDGWMGGGASTILNGLVPEPRVLPDRSGRSSANGGVPPLISVPTSPTEFVSMNPAAVVRHSRRHRWPNRGR